MSKAIMVVDDEPSVLKVVVFRLKKAGFEVIAAGDGESALEMLKDNRPNLILLDIALPGINGYEVCKRVKADESLKSIPILFFSASTASVKIEDMIAQCGAQGYVTKPFELEDLLSKIKTLTG